MSLDLISDFREGVLNDESRLGHQVLFTLGMNKILPNITVLNVGQHIGKGEGKELSGVL